MSTTGPPRDRTDADEARSPAPSRRRARRLVQAGLAVFVLAWLAVAVAQVLSAASLLREGRADVAFAQEQIGDDLGSFIRLARETDGTAGPAELSERLDRGARSLALGGERLDSWALAPFRVMPMVGRQLSAGTTLVGSASEMAAEASAAFASLQQIIDEPVQGPSDRVAVAEETRTVLEELAAAIEDPDLGPAEGLTTPLAEARNDFAEEHARLSTTLAEATTAVNGVTDFLRGPNRYLVLAANNAEMRAGSGMFLQAGTMQVQDGAFEIGELRPTGDLYVSEPPGIEDPDIRANWGWLVPDQEWRNLNLTPRFDQSAEMAARMWEASGGPPVDGVIAVDVIALQRMLEIVGPVDVGVPGAPDVVSAENVVSDLTLGQYEDFRDANDSRRERLGRVASATLEAFNTKDVSVPDLLEVLRRSGTERHLLAWSSDEAQMAGWEAVGAAGELPQDSLLLSLINRSGNKLDPFIEVSAELSATPSDDGHRIEVAVSVTNAAPPGLPAYVQGPHDEDLGPGSHLGILTLNVPGGAGDLTVSGGPSGFTGDDGSTRVAATTVNLAPGESTEVVYSFELTEEWDQVVVQPSARIPPTTWTAGAESFPDVAPRAVDLDELAG